MAGFLGNLMNFFTGGSGAQAARQSAAAATKYANLGAQAQSAPIKTAEQQALGYEGTSTLPYQTIFSQGQPAVNTYYGALGIGDPAQIAASQAAFKASPAYEYSLGQGLEGLSRVGTSTGQIGQADENAMAFAQNLANQDFQQWLTNLSQGFGQETTGAGGIQRGGLAQALTATQAGEDLSKIQGGRYSTIGAAQSALPMNINAAYMGGAGNTLSALFGLGELATGVPGSSLMNLPGGTSNYINALMGGTGGWNTTVTPGG